MDFDDLVDEVDCEYAYAHTLSLIEKDRWLENATLKLIRDSCRWLYAAAIPHVVGLSDRMPLN
jgi:hypothetical protein